MFRDIKRNRLFFLLSASLLFLSFSINLFGAMTTDEFVHNFKDSEALVVNQLACKGALYGDQLVESKVTKTNHNFCDPDQHKAYSSQFGLQGKLYTAGYWLASSVVAVAPSAFVAFAQLMTALLSAIVLAAFVLWVRVRYGVIPASITTLLITMSPILVGFSRNLYWALPLLILPFVYVMYSYSTKGTTKKKMIFWCILFVLLYIRLLCGYEFVTTLTLMLIAGVAYHLYLSKSALKVYVREIAIVFGVSILSFIAALGTHIYALKSYTGSADRAVQVIKARAEERTTDSAAYLDYAFSGFKATLPDAYQTANTYLHLDVQMEKNSEKWATLVSAMNYILLPVVRVPIALVQPFATYVQSLGFFVALLAVLYITRTRWLAAKLKRELDGLYIGALFGLVGYLSWLVLAHSHALVHAHINGILIYLPFALFGYTIIGLWIQSLYVRSREVRRKK